MSLRNIAIVYRKEMLEAVRDRRTLISTIAVPILLFPVLTVGMGYAAVSLIGAASRQPAKIMIVGGRDSPAIVEGLNKNKSLIVVAESGDYVSQISNKKIRAAVEIPTGLQSGDAGNSPVKIYIYAGDLKSASAASRIEKFFTEYRDTIARERLAAENLPAALLKPFEIKQQNVVSEEKIAGETVGGIIPYLVIIMCLTGAMYPAMDLTAGEKERATMETILSSPISRTHLVLGKFLLVLTASLVTAALSVTSMGVSSWVFQRFQDQNSGMHISIGILAVLSVFLVALPLAVLFSAALITIALFAKSYKEAQSYISPLMVVVIVPAVAAILPGVELTPRLSLVPILNVSLLCKDLIAGTYHWNSIALIFLSTCLYAAAALFIAVKMFQRESVLFRS
ncbi:MAG: ABC transporter permease [Acidobacteriota bacterium]|nr:ABC transporter permease [Acidobacteriota bacterium]